MVWDFFFFFGEGGGGYGRIVITNCVMHTQISYEFSVSYHKINYAMIFDTLSHCFCQDPAKYKVSSDVGPIALLRNGVPGVALLEK